MHLPGVSFELNVLLEWQFTNRHVPKLGLKVMRREEEIGEIWG